MTKPSTKSTADLIADRCMLAPEEQFNAEGLATICNEYNEQVTHALREDASTITLIFKDNSYITFQFHAEKIGINTGIAEKIIVAREASNHVH